MDPIKVRIMSAAIKKALADKGTHLLTPKEEIEEFGFCLEHIGRHIFIGNFPEDNDYWRIFCETGTRPGIAYVKRGLYKGRKSLYPEANNEGFAYWLLIEPKKQ